MPSRTLNLYVPKELYNEDDDESLKITISDEDQGLNVPFGIHKPTKISFDFPVSSLCADYKSGVYFSYVVLLIMNGAWYQIKEDNNGEYEIDYCSNTVSLSIDSQNLPDWTVTNLQKYSIDCIRVQPTSSNRLLRGKGGPASCTIYYEDMSPTLSWSNNTLTADYENGKINLSWHAATGLNGSGNVNYTIYCDGNIIDTTQSTSFSVTPSVYNQECSFQILAQYNGTCNAWSKEASITVTVEENTIRLYDGTGWVDCVIKLYDGVSWVLCTARYHDGSSFVDCSF